VIPQDDEAQEQPPALPYNITNPAELSLALASIETRLNKTLTNGITKITESLNQALIGQAQINATFATSIQVDKLRADLSDVQQQAAARAERISAAENKITALESQLATAQRDASNRTVSSLTQLLGWVVAVVLALATPILTFILTHVSTVTH